jgi:uncharacterized membrane protein SirB2
MMAYYPQIKAIHVHAVGLNFALFFLRGCLMLMRSGYSNHALLRYTSYVIDTILLTAALILVTLLHPYPFVHAWLTAKISLLVVYIVLGSLALKRGKTRRAQVTALVAACLTFMMMFGIARAHHWAGPFATWW